MAKSFAQYASQFLLQQQNPESSLSSSQPLFFSFTTDEGSRASNVHNSELDDLDDPHLRGHAGGMSGRGDHRSRIHEIEEDPYLRLDEEDMPPGASRHASQSVPLIASDYGQAESQDFPKGWLAHQASPPRRFRASSPSPSRSSLDSPGPIAGPSHRPIQPSMLSQSPPPPPPPHSREAVSLSLTQSLLPRDGTTRPIDVFSLPDPRHISRARRKFNDSHWTILWCTGVTLCFFFSLLLMFVAQLPKKIEGRPLPYLTLLHTVPLLTILTFVSAAVAYAHIFLLRMFVKPVMVVTSVFIPVTLFISAIWAFVGSFMWDSDQEPTWGESVGLRLFAIVPLVFSILTARRLIDLPRKIHSASSILDLSSQLLMSNFFLMALSPAMLLITLIASIPFITLIFRLLLMGYFPQGQSEWRIQEWADWAIVGTVGVWLWSWGVARGILRTTCAGVIGAWYYADPGQTPPPPMDTHVIHAAIVRATYPSLGSIVLSALIMAGIRILTLLTIALRLLPSYFPLVLRPWLQPLTMGAGMAVSYLESVTTSFSMYALVYTGLTGDPFLPSARRARALTAAVESPGAGRFRRKFKTEPQLTMLTYTPLTLTFPFALMTYLFVAHTLSAPNSALGAAVLAGGVTALVGLFCVGLVKDTADVLYLCYCIDKDEGKKRREEVFAAFEYDLQPKPPSSATPPQPQPATQTLPQYNAPAKTRPLPMSSPPPATLLPMSPSHNVSPPPRTIQTVALPEPTRSLPPATPDTDIDPFELDPYVHEEQHPPEMHPATPYSLSPEIEPSVHADHEEDDRDVNEDSQLFPGSGLF
ncbi:plasma-membrane choline transporter-domain-containing protein [Boletus edulis BED1]|uniref:Plasma-membrane choline transporter-domain-containing protein n=1 Tax=Boletus edulis BED1 TaxID=1328754 RepID=A0AAD4C3K1_BOLED|nr:plasma-membrane choline transporter-domain-containing protein [Boletus edulis BED1]